MAHIEKATAGQVGGLVAHDERTCENHTNEKIRVEDSHLNYSFLSESGMARYRQICENSFVLKRKNVNTLAMIAVTLPKDVKAGDEAAFFESCHKFLTLYFGEQSVVSSTVHLDETTPHLHFKAVPRYWNEKKERWQVSFDKVCPRSFYQNFHNELSNEVERSLGYKVSIENGATAKGNKTKLELELDEILNKLATAEKMLINLNSTINLQELAKEGFMDELEALQAEVDTYRAFMDEIRPYVPAELRRDIVGYSSNLSNNRKKTKALEQFISSRGLDAEFKKFMQQKNKTWGR